MRYLVIILFLGLFSGLHSQNTLPYSVNNICLDRIKFVSATGSPLRPTKNLVVKDFNSDGFDEVMLADTASGKLYVYQNNTNGTFSQITVRNINIANCNSTDAGDFDNDGALDIAVSLKDSILIFRNMGAFTFSLVGQYVFDPALMLKNFPSHIKTAKLSPDPFPDLAIIAPKISGAGVGVVALKNTSTGPGIFGFSIDYTTTVMSSTANILFNKFDTISLSVGNYDNDLNNDEIIVINKRDTNNLCVLKNLTTAGTLTFQVKSVSTGSITFGQAKVGISAVEVVDMNNDGSNELVAIARAIPPSGPTLQGFAYFNGSTSNFSTYVLPSVPGTYQLPLVSNNPVTHQFVPTCLAVGDINGDGFKDIIGMNNNYLVICPYHPELINAPLSPFIANGINDFIVINITGASVFAEETAVGRFDNNSRIDIFFKPWRGGGGPVGVIPNYSSKILATPVNTTVCPGNSVNLTATPFPTLVPAYNVDWYQTPGNTNIGTGNPFTSTLTGKFYPILNFPFPGGVGSCSISPRLPNDTVKVNGLATPVFTLTDDSPEVCPGTNATVTAMTSGSINYSYLWLLNGNTISNNATMITPAINGFTTITLVVTDPVSTCTASQIVPVKIYILDSAPLVISKNPICPGDSSLISWPGATTYSWSNGRSDTMIYVKPVTDFTVGLNFSDNKGCDQKRFATILIDKDCKIKFYNTVTVNGDSKNDRFFIDNIGQFKNNRVMIYNRWGKKLFDETHYDNETVFWPEQGKAPVPSTYFFVIDLGNGSELIKGWIEIIK